MKADIIPARTAVERALAEAFHASKAALPGSTEVSKWREGSFKAFSASGLPHRRIETWHYTDLRALIRESLPLAIPPTPATVEALGKQFSSDAPKQRLVLVDGFFVPELSDALPEGLAVRSLASALTEGRSELIDQLSSGNLAAEDSIVSLNAALMQDGVLIEVAPGTVIAEPVHLIHVTCSPGPTAHFSRSVLSIGPGASIQVAESCRVTEQAGAPVEQTNACLVISLGDGATLSHTAMIDGSSSGSVRVESVLARIGARAKFDSLALVSGIGLVRRQMFVRMEGADSEASIKGVSLLGRREHADTTLRVEHLAEHCMSRETFKYILDEQATGVFQGKIRVAPEAQKTDSKMLSKAVLLSDEASMNSKPELEIFADDVVCGHGATTGSLDKDQLFYLQARGLPFAEAEALLLEAFAMDVIESIGHEGVIELFRRKLTAWLSSRRPSAVAPPLRGSGH